MNYKILDDKLKIASFSVLDLEKDRPEFLSDAAFYGPESQYIFLNEKFPVYDSVEVLVFCYMQSDTANREELKAFFQSDISKKIFAVLDWAIKERARKVA